MLPPATVRQKVDELSEALKAEGLWKSSPPDWVRRYQHKTEVGEGNFFEWLQFVYLPNLLQGGEAAQRPGIAPQAVKFFGSRPMDNRTLQLLVELDSLV